MLISDAPRNQNCLLPQVLAPTVMPPVLILEYVVGLPLNMVALWIFCFRLHVWATNTVYLLNLLLADILLLTNLPFRIHSLMHGERWHFGAHFCNINMTLLTINRSASISFMTLMGVIRYFKVVYPHHQINILWRHAVAISSLMWLMVILLRIPLLFSKIYLVVNDSTTCRSFNENESTTPAMWLHYSLFFMEFFLPFVLLIYFAVQINYILHSRQLDRDINVRRAKRLIVLMVLVFTVSFLPSAVIGIALLIFQELKHEDCSHFRLLGEIFHISLSFTYLNSVLDPLIYCFSSVMFRKALLSCLSDSCLSHLQVIQRANMASHG